jgi:rhodanese-related sulfurtransferase
VQKKFPNKDAAKLMIGDSDGRSYAIDVLEALEEAGYSNLVGIKGGYNAWFR